MGQNTWDASMLIFNLHLYLDELGGRLYILCLYYLNQVTNRLNEQVHMNNYQFNEKPWRKILTLL